LSENKGKPFTRLIISSGKGGTILFSMKDERGEEGGQSCPQRGTVFEEGALLSSLLGKGMQRATPRNKGRDIVPLARGEENGIRPDGTSFTRRDGGEGRFL